MGKIVKGEDFKKRMDLQTKVQFEDRAEVYDVSEPSSIVSKDLLDTQSKARAILEEARVEASQIKKEAREILEQVKAEMEKSRKQGEEWGYQDGLVQALEYLNKLHLLREKMFQNMEPQVVKLVFSIVERVIGQQMKENDTAILGVVKQALDAAIGNKILIRLNPSDLEKVRANEALLLSRVEATKTISFKEDDTVKSGGCVVESEVGTIDAQLDTQLTAIKKALGL
ncbi:MAG: FliH/SctL family protein [bacterium]